MSDQLCFVTIAINFFFEEFLPGQRTRQQQFRNKALLKETFIIDDLEHN